MALHQVGPCYDASHNPLDTCYTLDAVFCVCDDTLKCFGNDLNPSSLLGQWSDTATAVSTFGSGSAWSNTGGAEVYNDSSYATNLVGAATTPPSCTGAGGSALYAPTQFIQITGLGLSVPSGTTIFGFGVAASGHQVAGDGSGSGYIQFGNWGLTKFGHEYYALDPNSGWCAGATSPSAPYDFAQSAFGGGIGRESAAFSDWSVDAARGANSSCCTNSPTWCNPPGTGVTNQCDSNPVQKTTGAIDFHSFWDTSVLSPPPAPWSPSDVNDTSFGVFVAFVNIDKAASHTVSLDFIGVAVYYTGGGGGGPTKLGVTGVTREVFNVFDKRRVWGGR